MYPKNYTTGDEDGNCYPDLRGQSSFKGRLSLGYDGDDGDDEIPDLRGHGGSHVSNGVSSYRNEINNDDKEYYNRYGNDEEIPVKKPSKINRENDVRDYFQNKKAKKIHPLVNFIIYGDINEMHHNILGEHYCSDNDGDGLDDEQMLRLNIASAVQAYFEGKLHKNGYLFNEKLHKPQDLIK